MKIKMILEMEKYDAVTLYAQLISLTGEHFDDLEHSIEYDKIAELKQKLEEFIGIRKRKDVK